MELLAPMPRSPEFHFSSAAAATTTFPSSPPLFGEPFSYHHHYTSAPSSPTRAAAAIYSHFPFEFSFNSGDPPEISTADKLFEKGKIRPLHHPPPVAAASSPQSGARGRQKASPGFSSGNRQRESRSLSPLRNHSFFIKNSAFTSSSSSTASTGGGGNRKWRLKDLLLFRSASEGRATGRGSRDPLRRYTLLSSLTSFSSKRKKKGGEEEEEEDSKGGSFRSTESGSGSVRRGGGPPASAHEMHYTANRAAAGEKRKTTPLPYQRQGLFSCLQFNPAIRSITKGFSNFS